MHIRIETDVLLRLQTIGILNRGAEFSGFGWCRIEGKEIVVYDFVLLDLGSETFTEIPPEVIMPLMERPDRANMKVWCHCHPIGSGIPGPHNWSGTDERTCTKEPMGGSPEAVGWSVALVRTPGGWVGRIDNHLSKQTKHLEVFPKLDDVYQAVAQVRERRAEQKRVNLVLAISRQFSEDDLKALELDRESLEDWIDDEFGDDLETLVGMNGWYDDAYFEDDEEGWTQPGLFQQGGRQWTTRGTRISSGPRI